MVSIEWFSTNEYGAHSDEELSHYGDQGDSGFLAGLEQALVGCPEGCITTYSTQGGEVEASADARIALFADATFAIHAGAGLAVLGGQAGKRSELTSQLETPQVAKLCNNRSSHDESGSADATKQVDIMLERDMLTHQGIHL